MRSLQVFILCLAWADATVEESFVTGGTLALTWSDCSDASYHGKVNALTPDTVTLGQKTQVTGTGTVDEAVATGTYTIDMSASILKQHWTGNVCEEKAFKLPLGLGSITWNGMKCPLVAGPTSVATEIQLSATIPAAFAKATINIKAQTGTGDKLLCMTLHTAPSTQKESEVTVPSTEVTVPSTENVQTKESFVTGGTLALTWSDCSDASYHGKVNALTPDSVTLGQKTQVTGTGTVDEAVATGTYTIDMSASILKQHWTGNVCEEKAFKLPLGLGSITWNGMKCPLVAGPTSVATEIQLSATIPAAFAKATINIKAQTGTGDKLLCMTLHTAPAENTIVV